MFNLYPYYYFAKSDSKKEAIDKIMAPSYEEALKFFANRKQIELSRFVEIYEIVKKDENKSK